MIHRGGGMKNTFMTLSFKKTIDMLFAKFQVGFNDLSNTSGISVLLLPKDPTIISI